MIHIEQQWAENLRTTDGRILHDKAHDSTAWEKRDDLIVTRDMSIHSPVLGISGRCDVVEFRRGKDGISISGLEGLWQPYPIEYKRGSPKVSDADRLQLCAQAMCLEEMLCCDIPKGALFYGDIRRREIVDLNAQLQREVRTLIELMHDLYRHSHTPESQTYQGL